MKNFLLIGCLLLVGCSRNNAPDVRSPIVDSGNAQWIPGSADTSAKQFCFTWDSTNRDKPIVYCARVTGNTDGEHSLQFVQK